MNFRKNYIEKQVASHYVDKLDKLKTLYEDNTITEDDYNQKVNEINDEMKKEIKKKNLVIVIPTMIFALILLLISIIFYLKYV